MIASPNVAASQSGPSLLASKNISSLSRFDDCFFFFLPVLWCGCKGFDVSKMAVRLLLVCEAV